jgi:hypothetical protein
VPGSDSLQTRYMVEITTKGGNRKVSLYFDNIDRATQSFYQASKPSSSYKKADVRLYMVEDGRQELLKARVKG